MFCIIKCDSASKSLNLGIRSVFQTWSAEHSMSRQVNIRIRKRRDQFFFNVSTRPGSVFLILLNPSLWVVPTKQCRFGNTALFYFVNTWFFAMFCQKTWHVTYWNYWPSLFCRDYLHFSVNTFGEFMVGWVEWILLLGFACRGNIFKSYSWHRFTNKTVRNYGLQILDRQYT